MAVNENQFMKNGQNNTGAYAAKSALGKTSRYPPAYDRTLLHAIPRSAYRDTLQSNVSLATAHAPSQGFDVWHCFELSWLNDKGKPRFAWARFSVDANSEFIVESKSLKLYLASLNQQRFATVLELEQTVSKDISDACACTVLFNVQHNTALHADSRSIDSDLAAISLDDIDIDCSVYKREASLLTVMDNTVEQELLHSRLLRSNCPVTGQPDWAELTISYSGQRIEPQSLLQYIVSYRQHSGFHEQTIEQIYTDLAGLPGMQELAVLGRYTRRGGIAISVLRGSTAAISTLDELAVAAAPGQ
ncbi:MAG: NADPH-dependent 7-cyano-7-deazaguanine reductase QueF [Gammaproteobacteria bacterium]|nr:NADPH-dependent 7-cyano-7-deazaguanine reductase QueF [Gammaproteobacteria bacterium]RZV54596.1 MAG: NADPH-dependent 7-cyano-7-deazaguanine reductase QueF [Pseudomonadales bacterium]